jgi:hypothetical protein
MKEARSLEGTKMAMEGEKKKEKSLAAAIGAKKSRAAHI